MGYYSNFRITAVRNNGETSYKDIIAAIAKVSKIPESRFNIVNKPTKDTYIFEIEINDVKWYNEADHMKEVAKSYPNFYFLVERRGEYDTDESLEVYSGNKYAIREMIVISPFEQFLQNNDVEDELREIASVYCDSL